jgi:hypothetical protein
MKQGDVAMLLRAVFMYVIASFPWNGQDSFMNEGDVADD